MQCRNNFPIDLTSSKILFAVKLIGKVQLQSKFGLFQQVSEKIYLSASNGYTRLELLVSPSERLMKFKKTAPIFLGTCMISYMLPNKYTAIRLRTLRASL